MNEDQLSLEDKVKVFLGLKSHEEKCAYFHDHPELEAIFGSHHFPPPSDSGAASPKPKAADKTTVPKPK